MDPSLFMHLYRANAKKLYNFILWTTGDRSACDDILQNVFIKIWRSTSAPQSSDEQTAWLFTISRNACVDYFRSKRKHYEYKDGVGVCKYGSKENDYGKEVWRLVAKLEETERAIIYLHIKLGYTYSEIGNLTGLTENCVRVKAFRSFRKLRAILSGKGI